MHRVKWLLGIVWVRAKSLEGAGRGGKQKGRGREVQAVGGCRHGGMQAAGGYRQRDV